MIIRYIELLYLTYVIPSHFAYYNPVWPIALYIGRKIWQVYCRGVYHFLNNCCYSQKRLLTLHWLIVIVHILLYIPPPHWFGYLGNVSCTYARSHDLAAESSLFQIGADDWPRLTGLVDRSIYQIMTGQYDESAKTWTHIKVLYALCILLAAIVLALFVVCFMMILEVQKEFNSEVQLRKVSRIYLLLSLHTVLVLGLRNADFACS